MENCSRPAAIGATLVDMTKTPWAPLIRSQAELQQVWQRLMGPGGFGGRSVWLLMIQDDRPLPQITEITESDDPPDDTGLHGLAHLLTHLSESVAPDLRFAFLRSRPGPAMVTQDDRRWARALYDACRLAGVPCEIVHLATKDAVRPLPPDELISLASA